MHLISFFCLLLFLHSSYSQSLINLGAIPGGPIAGVFLDVYGRKLTLMLCAVPYVAGWVAIATANNIGGLYVGRILTGVAAGMTSLVTPVSRGVGVGVATVAKLHKIGLNTTLLGSHHGS